MRDFANEMRAWRRKRRLSQLDLALVADVSARHVSFLESRRARPSRAMVLRLAERTIRRHAPYPAVILDRLWRLTALNESAGLLFAPLGLGVGSSLLDALPADAATEAVLRHLAPGIDRDTPRTDLAIRRSSPRLAAREQSRRQT